MSAQQVIFLLTGIIIIGSSIMVVASRKLLHAALWLVVTLFGVAVLYTLLQANFLAVIQVVVYIGAIAILFIFSVMLTRRQQMEERNQTRKNWWLAAILGVLILAGLVMVILGFPNVGQGSVALPQGVDPLRLLGNSLVSPDAYLLPFEVASVLLLAALVGAVYVATMDRK